MKDTDNALLKGSPSMTTTPGPRTALIHLLDEGGYEWEDVHRAIDKVVEAEARADVDGLDSACLEAALVTLDPSHHIFPGERLTTRDVVVATHVLGYLRRNLGARYAAMSGDKAEAPRPKPKYTEAQILKGYDDAGDKAEAPTSTREDVLAGFIDLIETAAEDNGQNAVLVEDLPALARDFLHGNDKPSAGDKAEAPTPCCDDKGGAFCRDTTGLAGCFDGWEHTREAGDKAEAPE